MHTEIKKMNITNPCSSVMIRVQLFNNFRAGFPGNGFFDVFELTDDTPVAGGFEKLYQRLNLRAHGAGRELAVLNISFYLRQLNLTQHLLIGFPPVDSSTFNTSGRLKLAGTSVPSLSILRSIVPLSISRSSFRAWRIWDA